MNGTQWISQAKAHSVKLVALIALYHPSNGKVTSTNVTAPRAEEVRLSLLDGIAEVQREKLGDVPATLAFTQALDAGNALAAYEVLSATWFGVPESTDSRNIPGFFDLCDLCDDPPEDAETSDDADAEWRQEIAMQAGMGGGCDAYNDAMGYSVEFPEEEG